MKIIIISNLEQGMNDLKNYSFDVWIINNIGTIRYWGIAVIHYVFKKLKETFNNIRKIIINIDDDLAAFFSVLKLGYTDILYRGNSYSVQQIAQLKSITLYSCDLLL